MADIPDDIFVWRDYALCLVTARVMERRGFRDTIKRVMEIAARSIYDNAGPSALPGLDAIKRVMEIDTNVTNPATVLWRAGAEQLDMARKIDMMPERTP
jgi:hypothetical protein